MFFAGMALGAMAGAAFGIGLMCCVVAGKQRRSADGADADTQTETGRTKTDPVPRYGRDKAVHPFWMGKVFA